jgi:phytanoyl-CoA hydroxylase
MYSPDQLLDLTLQYNTQGFVHLRGLLPAPLLARARQAFDAKAERHAATVRTAQASDARFHDLPAILDADPVFVDLVDLAPLLSLLRLTVGEDLALNDTNARLFFPGPTFTSPYHSDLARVAGIDPARCPGFLAKVHFYLEDLAPEQGCLSFIPGSQHLPPLYVDAHRPTLAGSLAVTRVVPRAGDAILFNTHVLHMAEANLTQQVRKSLIYTYGHFWMKAYASAMPANTACYADNPVRQQLFNVALPGVGHFNRRLDRLAQASTGTRLRALCERFVHRVLPVDSLPPRA